MTGQRPDHGAAARKLGDALRSLQQQSGRTLRSLETQVRISDSSLSRYFKGSPCRRGPWSPSCATYWELTRSSTGRCGRPLTGPSPLSATGRHS